MMITVFSVAIVSLGIGVLYLIKSQNEMLSIVKNSEKGADKEAIKRIFTEINKVRQLLKEQTVTSKNSLKSGRQLVSKEAVKELIGDLESEGLITKENAHSAKDIIIIQEFINTVDEELTSAEEMAVILDEARELVKATGVASITNLKSQLDISKYDAENILNKLEEEGIVGPSDGSSHRNVFERE